MHIPDGYLSPATCATFGGAMVPVWATAGRKVKRVVRSRYVPLVAIGAAYSFLVMMFNVPIPDGTTAHAVGAVLIACLLGPWAAVVAVSVALFIQALFFGDGGVLAYGANAFNMAFVMPFVGYGVYRLASRRLSLTSPRRALAAGMGAYVGLNAAALCAAIEFGVQPDLFRSANGTPLYAPFHLSQTVPTMLFAHLTVAGAVEAVLTFGVIAYLQRANVPILRINHRGVAETDAELTRAPLGWRWALIGIATMVVLTPLGLLAPGRAFGEDRARDLNAGKYGLRVVPAGLARYNGFWEHTVLRSYGFGAGSHPAVAYLLSAVVGIVAVSALVLGVYGLSRTLSRRNARELA
ncbi:MAG: cobalamin [Actinomycetia bacterium]|nr:cobalamin [Actinomycetes bacterium]